MVRIYNYNYSSIVSPTPAIMLTKQDFFQNEERSLVIASTGEHTGCNNVNTIVSPMPANMLAEQTTSFNYSIASMLATLATGLCNMSLMCMASRLLNSRSYFGFNY